VTQLSPEIVSYIEELVGIEPIPWVELSLTDIGSGKVAVTIKSLLDTVQNNILDNASNCSTSLYRRDKKFQRLFFRSSCNESYSAGPWTSRVYFIGGRSRKRKTQDVKVSCNCTYFKYWGPLHNTMTMGALNRDRKRVQAPNVRDPGRDHILCKHLNNALVIALGERTKYLKSKPKA